VVSRGRPDFPTGGVASFATRTDLEGVARSAQKYSRLLSFRYPASPDLHKIPG